ncbi:MAG: baseplate J/gp47 family protein [Vulcanibacillus sp.]
MTYEDILQRMLDSVSSDVDKREGSIIYNALAPAAFELAQMYIELDTVLELVFANTSSGEYLDKRCVEMGIVRKQATKAIRKGEFNTTIPIGTKFGIDDLIYKVVEIIDGYNYKLECQTTGEIGNTPFGTLLPIDYVAGLTTAILSEVLIPGEDEETDASLLTRFNTRVQKSSTSGNVYHYLEWATEVSGVGATKVVAKWAGDNTVKIIIVGTDMQPASSVLIEEVQNHIDPNTEGLGNGEAPIGAMCTVVSAFSTGINITADISGTTAANVIDNFTQALNNYFKTLVTNDWQTKESYIVSYAKIGSLLLDSIIEAGGIDYSNLLVNSATQNVQLTNDIPSIGTVTLNEIA